MRCIAIIPARGGSKRIPNKNIRDFLGKPLISYSIQNAIDCKSFDEIMVSTDDSKIANIAKKYGATVPFIRSKKASDDFATTAEVLLEVLNNYKKIYQKDFDYCCCIYPAAPLIKYSDILNGYRLLRDENLDTVFAAVENSRPIWRSFKILSEGTAEMIWPEHLRSRSQDLTRTYHDAGQWYWFKCNTFLDKKRLFTDRASIVVLDENKTQDIDTFSDLKIAEMKFRLLEKD